MLTPGLILALPALRHDRCSDEGPAAFKTASRTLERDGCPARSHPSSVGWRLEGVHFLAPTKRCHKNTLCPLTSSCWGQSEEAAPEHAVWTVPSRFLPSLWHQGCLPHAPAPAAGPSTHPVPSIRPRAQTAAAPMLTQLDPSIAPGVMLMNVEDGKLQHWCLHCWHTPKVALADHQTVGISLGSVAKSKQHSRRAPGCGWAYAPGRAALPEVVCSAPPAGAPCVSMSQLHLPRGDRKKRCPATQCSVVPKTNMFH